MRVLKEPLLHFFLIGAAIFVWFHIVAPESENVEYLEKITLDQDDVALLSARFEAQWKRPPSDAELKALVDASIREEVLVREARQLGLDRGDPLIRTRLSQKMDYLTEAIATSIVPNDEDLEVFLQENAERYATPVMVAFNQAFLGEEPGEAEIEKALATLRAKQDISDLGGSTLLPASMPLSATRVVESVFGGGFSQSITEVETGQWTGPIRSGYGIHLVEVVAVEPSRTPPLAEIHNTVLRDWRRAMSEDLAQAQYQSLAEKYEIVAPDLSGPAK